MILWHFGNTAQPAVQFYRVRIRIRRAREFQISVIHRFTSHNHIQIQYRRVSSAKQTDIACRSVRRRRSSFVVRAADRERRALFYFSRRAEHTRESRESVYSSIYKYNTHVKKSTCFAVSASESATPLPKTPHIIIRYVYI